MALFWASDGLYGFYRAIDIVEDMMSSRIFAGMSRATYILFNIVAKMLIKHQGVFPFLVQLVKDIKRKILLATRIFMTRVCTV